MTQEISRKEVIDILADIVRGDITENSDKYIITVKTMMTGNDPIVIDVYFKDIDDLLLKIKPLDIYDETSLVNSNYYEVVVREETTRPIRRIRDAIKINDEENEIIYEVSPSSHAYYIWLMLNIKNRLSLRDFRMGFGSASIFRRLEGQREIEGKAAFLELMDILCKLLITLKISSKKDLSPSQQLKQAHAFLFHVGYNLDTALVPQRFLEEIMRRGRINRMRRSSFEDIDPPRRTYNESLVQHYLLAVSTENPVIEFLSYYHILEHFYEAVFNDELLDTVKNKITDPSFSYKRKNIQQKIL